MPIEIKELRITVHVQEQTDENPSNSALTQQNWAQLEQQVVDSCVRKVLEKIKEKEER